MSPVIQAINPTTPWADGIKLSIQEGFTNVIDGIGASISNAFSKVLIGTGSFLLNGVCIFVVYFMVFTAFKVMVTIDKDKQSDNFNMLGISAGIYMSVRMVMEIIKYSSGG